MAPMRLTSMHKIALLAVAVYATDQATKRWLVGALQYAEQHIVVDGFFKLVHWGNTGAAFSIFHGNNGLLALVSLLAMAALLLMRRHFEVDRLLGQVATGFILGGILGNLTDRLLIGHVVDFLYFHLRQRGGGEIGFPAFNIADSAICCGVGLMFLISFQAENTEPTDGQNPA